MPYLCYKSASSFKTFLVPSFIQFNPKSLVFGCCVLLVSKMMMELLGTWLPVALRVLLHRCSQITVSFTAWGFERSCLMWDVWSWNDLAYILRLSACDMRSSYAHMACAIGSFCGTSAKVVIQWIKKGMGNWIQKPDLISGRNTELPQKDFWLSIIWGWVRICLKLPAWVSVKEDA